MISGAAGLGRTGTNPYGAMTTLSGIMQIGDADLVGAKDGIVPVQSTAQGDAVRKVLAKTEFTTQFKNGWKGLQQGLVARGMSPLFPEGLAGPLADPIVGGHRGNVYPLTFDLDALGKKAGSPLMFAAFREAMGNAAEKISRVQYMNLVADVFKVDPENLAAWHMLGSGIDPYVSGRELNPGVQYLANLVESAQLLRLNKKVPEMWRIVLPAAMSQSDDSNVDEALVAALEGSRANTDLPTVVDVLNAAADVFRNGVKRTNSGGNGERVNPFETTEAIVSGTIHRV